MYTIDINCDMGEGLANDAWLMPWITSTNIACGYHAGNADIMKQTVELALQHGVAVGAHPGFADKENFGRTEMQLPLTEVYDLVSEQLRVLQEISISLGTRLRHVKPHGALYNMAAKDPELAHAIAEAVYAFDKNLVLFGLSGSCSITETKKVGLQTASEVFADRSYQDDGSLTPRNKPGALLVDTKAAIGQALQMVTRQTVTSVNDIAVPLVAETLCIHGDGEHAVDFAKQIFHTLKQQAIGIESI
ncbi:MAG: LamB/YcsF family protein [Sediminibacterium sp.]|nr:LamB/YcsF family protein [Sediminibacterium sp.]